MLGERDRRDVPKILNGMDVNVMVYKESDASWTKVAYPLKLHEYLAIGRPIVSMPLPMLQSLGPVIRFASGLNDWLSAIDHAIGHGGQGSVKARKEATKGHSWDDRVDTLRHWLSQLDGAKSCAT